MTSAAKKLRPDGESGLSASLATPSKSKLAENVARELEHEIIERGWPVGEVLGSEAELLARLGVSRAVLREAVRLLEHHFVATMRRGPGGGLVVTAPDTSAAARATALTLEYQGATIRDLLEARSALELKCVELATGRIDEDGIELLRQTLDAEAVSGNGRDGLGGTHDLHRVIAQITGNPAFVVFLEVLTRLTNHSMSTGPHDGTIAEGVRKAHEKIAEAIILGDPGLARHRMQSHLEAMASWLSPAAVSAKPTEPLRRRSA
jgi:DNA-binding FadR family transcriptional regulator